MVAEYAGISFYEALELPVDMFRNMLRNTIIDKLNQTPKGKEILKTWRRMNITEVDDKNIDFFKQFT